MLKKIIWFVIIACGLFYFYNKFVASSVEPFFRGKAGKVDLYQIDTKDSKKAESIARESKDR